MKQELYLPKVKSFGECFRGLLGLLSPLWGRVAVSVFNGLVAVSASLAYVWISKKVVDIATGQSDGALLPNVLLFAAVMLIQIACRLFSRYWEALMVVDTQNRTRKEVFDKVIRAAWDGRDRFHSGDTVNRLEEDVRVIADFLCVNMPEMIVTCVQLLAATWMLFELSPKLGWVLIWIMPVAVIGSRLFFLTLRRITKDIRKTDSEIQAHMQETVQNRLLVRMMGGTGGASSKLEGMQNSVRGKIVKRMNYSTVARGAMSVGFAAGYALVFIWSVYGLKNGTVTYGLMVAFLQLVNQVQRPVAELANQIPSFIRALSSEERVLELCEQPQEASERDIRMEGAPGIRLRDLSFGYPDAEVQVLSALNFDFKPGSLTALMGYTGAGKSTLIKVILALLKPTGGEVSIYDGTKELPVGVGTRCNFQYVPQGNSLMSGTIRQNLLIANAEATEDELRAALHAAVADFVFELKDGLDTVCGEDGVGISEGQAQRVAVARALLRPGGVLVLDEATSALDAATEQELLRRLHEHCSGAKTIICISHRPAVEEYADRILRIS